MVPSKKQGKTQSHSRKRNKTGIRSTDLQSSVKESIEYKVALYLNDALAFENAVLERLQLRVTHTTLQGAKTQLQNHLRETTGQQDRLKQLISSLGGTPTKGNAQLPVLSTSESTMGLLKKDMNDVELELNETKEDAIIVYAEIALYDTLRQIIEKAKIDSVVRVLTQNINEEASMAYQLKVKTADLIGKLWASIDSTSTRTVSEAGPLAR